jgi:putative membrane protein
MTARDSTPRSSLPALPGDLGQINTILSADRTLMSWIRTALSMISFGFTIYKVLDVLARNGQIARSESPRQVGLFLCAMGVASVVLGTMGYWATLRDLQRIQPFRLGRPVLVMALILSLAGIGLFAGILWRLA